MYKIIKFVNNNVVIVQDSKLRERVVFGKGIGFKKSIGEILSENMIQKKYLLSDVENKEIMNIIEEVDYSLILLCEEIKTLIEDEYDMVYSPYLFFNLVDHINGAVDRNKMQNNINTTTTLSSLEIYKKKVDLTHEIVKLININLGIELYESEVVFIAIHIISFIYDTNFNQLDKDVIQITNEILEILKHLIRAYLCKDLLFI